MKILVSDKVGLENYITNNGFDDYYRSSSFIKEFNKIKLKERNALIDIYIDVDILTTEVIEALEKYDKFISTHLLHLPIYNGSYNAEKVEKLYNQFDSMKFKLADDVIISGNILIDCSNTLLNNKLIRCIANQALKQDAYLKMFSYNPIFTKKDKFYNYIEFVDATNLYNNLLNILKEADVRRKILINNGLDSHTKLNTDFTPMVIIINDWYTYHVISNLLEDYKLYDKINHIIDSLLSNNLDKLNMTVIISSFLSDNSAVVPNRIYRKFKSVIYTEKDTYVYSDIKIDVSFGKCLLHIPSVNYIKEFEVKEN